MSQLNVDTLGGQTGTTISIASGHTLSGVASTNGITNLQQFRLNANLTSNAQYITANWEAPDSDYEAIGSIVSESSGVFSFSATGKYLIILQGTGYSTGYHNLQIHCYYFPMNILSRNWYFLF